MEKLKELSFWDWMKQLFFAYLIYIMFTGKRFNSFLDGILYYAYDYEKYGYGSVAVRCIFVVTFFVAFLIVMGTLIDKVMKSRS